MKKYLSIFRLRFSMGLQYRVAAFAGIITQFVWGIIDILVFIAFYDTQAEAFPMSLQATVSYIWLQQAFLSVFAAWLMENEIFLSIMNGNIAYELCRPINIYDMWFYRTMAVRLSCAMLRCFPIMIIAALLPEPYGIQAPASLQHFLLFLITMIFGFLVIVSFIMIVYGITFYTISPFGVKMIFISTVEFLSGGVIPLPFFPERIREVVELLPFASMQNVPLQIYSGSMTEKETVRAVTIQIIWLIILVMSGKILYHRAEKNSVFREVDAYEAYIEAET